jgi:hypothetical protein
MSDNLIIGIDDDESELAPNVPDGFKLEVVDPNDEKLADKLAERIGSACLILLDQKFNTEPKLSLKASDGASFVAHLRSWARQEAKGLAPVVLFTADNEAFKNEIPAVGPALPLNGTFVGREFQIAPSLDVEWVQHKGEDNAKARIAQLAEASAQARSTIGDDGASLEELEELLCLPEDRVWTERAKEELRAARPPVTQNESAVPEPCGPSQAIRWMCHRALPFPGMLLSDLYAAWALGVSVEVFKNMAELADNTHATAWLSDLDDAEYYGPLDEFLGRRWWKSGIDYVAYKLDQETSKQKDRARAFNLLAPSVEIGKLHSTSTHVVTWTADLVENEISSIDDSVQLRPPGWPVEALEPWILKSDMDNDAVLQAMAESSDLS